MPDSEEECDTWRNRDKYPKEREEVKLIGSQSPKEISSESLTRNDFNRNEKRSFDNYQCSKKSAEPPFKRQRREPGEDVGSFIKPFNNNFRDNKDIKLESNYENRYNSISKATDDSSNYPSQPQMLSFKYFLQQQDDNIEMDEAMKKYNEYKEDFITKQLKVFYQAYNNQEWFREKYLPSFVDKRKLDIEKNIKSRRDIFLYLLENNWINNIKVHVDETDSLVRLMDAVVILLEGGDAHDLTILFTKKCQSESPNDSSEIDAISTKSPDKLLVPISFANSELTVIDQKSEIEKEFTEVIKVSEVVKSDNSASRFDKKNEQRDPKALHKTYSIFLRNVHPNVLRCEIEALVKPFQGFLRLALQDPSPDRKFFRRGWVTFDRTVNIKKICWDLNNIRLNDCDIGAIVNRELTQRVRPVMVLTNHKPVMRNDVKIASKLIAKFDKFHNLWQKGDEKEPKIPLSSNNPLLENITEFLVDEGSYEEEELLKGNLNSYLGTSTDGADHINTNIDFDESLATVLDKMILYLRLVHSFDYYSNTEYQIEDEMPHRCGIIHARGTHIHNDKLLTQKDVEEYIKNFELKADQILNSVDTLSMEEAIKLGYQSIDQAVEMFMCENTQEIAKDKWLCPLSGKKFKGPDFVRKHILNKHMDKVEQAKQNAEFFNNYLLDPKRPQFSEHSANRSGSAKSMEIGEISRDQVDNCRHQEGTATNFDNRNNRNMDNLRNMNRRNDDYEIRRNNYRSDHRCSSPSQGVHRDYHNRNSFGDNRGGNNGNYYRKSNYLSRGGSQTRNQRNSGGSYYARKLLSYNDLDAPIDD